MEEPQPKILYIDESVRAAQTAKLRKLRRERSNDAVARSLLALCHAAEKETENTMPHLLDCVKSYATVGEICNAFKKVYGSYEEASIT
jgi:methylmalonyl-CoA mutase N-terminal domain/subunit